MSSTPPAEPARPDHARIHEHPVGGPVAVSWREGVLTRAKELESLCGWIEAGDPRPEDEVLAHAVHCHVRAARDAAEAVRPDPPQRTRRLFRNASLLERAMSNLDAAEAQLLNIAPAKYVLGQLASVVSHTRSHLAPNDPRRQELEYVARTLGIAQQGEPCQHEANGQTLDEKLEIVEVQRGKIVTAWRAGCSAALREHVRLRSFRNVVVVATALMTLLAVGLAIFGWIDPAAFPMCFAPEESGQLTLVCPTERSTPFPPLGPPPTLEDIDNAISDTVRGSDILVVQLVGLAGATVAAVAAIHGIRGSSERVGLPVALAVLKLPTGAITAFLGLLLMRGQFVPGLSALDSSAQIIAWALVFGYAQELFTRLVDRQGQSVLESVRGADRPQASSSPS